VFLSIIYGMLTILEVSNRNIYFQKKTTKWLFDLDNNSIDHIYSFYNGKILHIHLTGGQKYYVSAKDKYSDKIVEEKLINILQSSNIHVTQIYNYENFIYFAYLSLYLFVLIFFVINVSGFIHSSKINSLNINKILPQKANIRINEVGGLFETKKEVIEFIEIVMNPIPYLERGVSIPRGVLLEGPPGTGKTMLAKAISNEYNINFFYVSGSDFSKPFVGLGSQFV
jgi:ATP-dependent Zn protease